jgi:NAD(P)-dependent dehydrogenase (short-subunit alcohol dehydrogenase family)
LHILVNSGSEPSRSTPAICAIETVVDQDLLQGFKLKYVGSTRNSRAVIPFTKQAGCGRIINVRNAGNLSGRAQIAPLVHKSKTPAVQLGRHRIRVNCIHPDTTRTEPAYCSRRLPNYQRFSF